MQFVIKTNALMLWGATAYFTQNASLVRCAAILTDPNGGIYQQRHISRDIPKNCYAVYYYNELLAVMRRYCQFNSSRLRDTWRGDICQQRCINSATESNS